MVMLLTEVAEVLINVYRPDSLGLPARAKAAFSALWKEYGSAESTANKILEIGRRPGSWR